MVCTAFSLIAGICFCRSDPGCFGDWMRSVAVMIFSLCVMVFELLWVCHMMYTAVVMIVRGWLAARVSREHEALCWVLQQFLCVVFSG